MLFATYLQQLHNEQNKRKSGSHALLWIYWSFHDRTTATTTNVVFPPISVGPFRSEHNHITWSVDFYMFSFSLASFSTESLTSNSQNHKRCRQKTIILYQESIGWITSNVSMMFLERRRKAILLFTKTCSINTDCTFLFFKWTSY